MAGNYGYNTYLISDATATFDKVGINGEKYDAEQIHQISLASLKDEFATVLTSKEIIRLLIVILLVPFSFRLILQ